MDPVNKRGKGGNACAAEDQIFCCLVSGNHQQILERPEKDRSDIFAGMFDTVSALRNAADRSRLGATITCV